MEFTNESASTLFHYCFELSDALRPIIGSKQFETINQNYWVDKLTELNTIIDGILQLPKQNDLIEGYEKANSILEIRDKIFCITLKALIIHQPDMDINQVIEVSNDTAKDSIQKLYQVEL